MAELHWHEGLAADNWDYQRMHLLVREKRGYADDQKCVDCGKQARHWSQMKGTTGRSIWNYAPRCSSCHTKYDLPK